VDNEPRHLVLTSAGDLGEPGDAPTPLDQPFTLGPPLEEMAGHPELAAAHQGWVELAGRTGASPTHGGVRERLALLVLGALRRHPEYRQQRELLAQLTRVVDALAKRCDELDRRLQRLHDEVGEIATVLSEDLTRLTALTASDKDPTRPSDG
jgi:hypothetical protein